jgi:hypothetical protein
MCSAGLKVDKLSILRGANLFNSYFQVFRQIVKDELAVLQQSAAV